MFQSLRSAAVTLAPPAAAVLFLLLAAAPARAASFQTFVSVNGNDANTSASCVRTNPCRLIKTALTVTSPGGVLTVLDSGGFGGFTVTQAVQVVAAPGVQATIQPIVSDSDAAVVVNAPGGGGRVPRVTLRNLYLASPGSPAQQTGLRVLNVDTLHVENCVITGFLDEGISVVPGGSVSRLFISDTVIRECGRGVSIQQGASFALRATFERVRVEDSIASNMIFKDNVEVVMRDSASSGGTFGLHVSSDTSGTKAEVMVENCLLTGNGIGIFASGGAGQGVVDVEGTTISFNNTGLASGTNGFINSRKDNTLRRNGTNGAFTTAYTPQ